MKFGSFLSDVSKESTPILLQWKTRKWKGESVSKDEEVSFGTSEDGEFPSKSLDLSCIQLASLQPQNQD